MLSHTTDKAIFEDTIIRWNNMHVDLERCYSQKIPRASMGNKKIPGPTIDAYGRYAWFDYQPLFQRRKTLMQCCFTYKWIIYFFY